MPTMDAPPPPTRSQIEQKFRAVLDASETRNSVDRWAERWLAARDAGIDDPVVWWALTLLYGIDMRHGPGEPYLHDDEQIAEWLQEFRRRCSLG